MKRRSKAGGEPIKGRRRKTPEPKRRNAPKAVARSNSSPASEETEVARLTRELNEARSSRQRPRRCSRLSVALPGDLAASFRYDPGECRPPLRRQLRNTFSFEKDDASALWQRTNAAAFAERIAGRTVASVPGDPLSTRTENKAMVHIRRPRGDASLRERHPRALQASNLVACGPSS